MRTVTLGRLSAATLPFLLGACALQAPATKVDAPLAAQWQAPLPHNGQLTDLSQWWKQQGDPLLAQLVEAGQAVSPTIAAAQSRIAQARAERTAAGAALGPTLDAAASISRANQQSSLPTGTTSQAALQAAWEIDVFGARRDERRAAQARLNGAGAQWHEARVSVAAEIANQYYSVRACEQLLSVARQDATSRADTARLTVQAFEAGLQSTSIAALARASAADASGRATLQQALCDIDVKTLVALTAVPETELRGKLAASAFVPPPAIVIDSLPARVLAQRPDVYSAEHEVTAASMDVGSAQAQRYPRLSLQGAVGVANFRADGVGTKLDTWTIGPLALTLPIFDGGRRSANVDAAKARYEQAVIGYRASVRQAVRDVEQAMVTLHSSNSRANDAQATLDGYRIYFNATEARYKGGLASLLELEEARRTRLAAENGVASLQRERSAAAVGLYRAAGGGWTAPAAQ
jgi:multidrug efflux system outer membrane protein